MNISLLVLSFSHKYYVTFLLDLGTDYFHSHNKEFEKQIHCIYCNTWLINN